MTFFFSIFTEHGSQESPGSDSRDSRDSDAPDRALAECPWSDFGRDPFADYKRMAREFREQDVRDGLVVPHCELRAWLGSLS